MQALYGHPVFEVDGETFFWEDVVLDALRRGKWTRLVGEVSDSLAALEAADEGPEDPDFEEAADDAAQEFRYERDLVTAQEMEDWLKLHGIGVREWMEFIRRNTLSTRIGTRRTSGARSERGDAAIGDELRVELICSGLGEQWAGELAERAAGAAAAAGSTLPESGTDVLGRTPPSPLPEGLSPERAGERLAVLDRVERGLQEFARSVLTTEAIRREISHRHTEWIRVDCRAIAFTDEAEAREAAFCLREDGLELDEVAATARAPVAESRFYLDDLEPDFRPVFLASRPVDLLGPMLFEGAHTLIRVVDKVMPSEQDPEIRRRAEAAVLARVLAEQARSRVRWRLGW
jgi:sarcosine oxidase delta subunit